MTHHVIVQFAAKRAGHRSYFRNYLLLGDDIVIKSSIVAKKYHEIMTSLGVEISKHKTIRSSTVFEFAKRTFFRGEEISHWPVKALADAAASKNYMLSALLLPLAERDYLPFRDGEVPILKSGAKTLYRKVLVPSRVRRLDKRIKASLSVHGLITKYMDPSFEANNSDVKALSRLICKLSTGSIPCNKDRQLVELTRAAIGSTLLSMTDSQIQKIKEENSNFQTRILQIVHSIKSSEGLLGLGGYSLKSVPALRANVFELAKLETLREELIQCSMDELD